ncbi:MAG TPA: glycosyltransferase family 9 protein [Glaciihabitans sp.]|nr:glycosyltransferase family 9 protein [Glaciihabitans sp.]
MRSVLVVRLDNIGDVLIAGPAIRAIANSPDVERVSVLCSSAGAAAARLLPGVSRVYEWNCPWITNPAPPVTPESISSLEQIINDCRPTDSVILTSYHQSPLPLALLLRLSGSSRITAASTDYAGSLLDVRLRPGEDFDEDQPEPIRALAIAGAAGFVSAAGDAAQLAVQLPDADLAAAEAIESAEGPYIVVHPGASVPARTWPADRHAAVVDELERRGWRVLVTGGAAEMDLTRTVAGQRGLNMGGCTDLPRLAALISRARVLVTGNTGPAHLAAAVGTPVVSLFSPVVPAVRWAPYGVPTVLLGDQSAACRNSRARECPVPGHPCLTGVTPTEVVDACLSLLETDVNQTQLLSAVEAP